MKTMKKVFAALLTLAMLLCMCAVPAFAADDGSITVNGTAGQTYTIYRIADLESHSGTAYSYKANSQWKTWLQSQTSYVTVDTQDYVTWTGTANDATYAAFAKAALAEAKKDGSSITSVDSKAIATSESSVTFSNLAEGWYLVDSSEGVLCILTTAANTATVNEKNGTPTVDKTVKEGETYGESDDAAIGDTVEFKTEITVQAGAQNYVLHDKMDAGLTLNADSIKVQVDGADVATTNYTKTTSGLTDGCTFEIAFTDSYVQGLNANTKITVTYSATLNENAVVASTGNKNETWIKYGDNSESTHDTTTTKTWDVDVFKYTGTNTALSGAKFTLSKNSNGTSPIAVATTSTTNTYRVDKTSTTTEITTGSTGKFTIQGLDSGTYYLTETEAPAGYNKLAAPVTINISNEGKVTIGGSTTEVTKVAVENKTGSELPSTGGMGTTIFYVVGGLLVAGAAITLIVRKRRTGYED